MDCAGFRERLEDCVAGRLDNVARGEVEAHRAACGECAALLRRRRRPPRLVAAGFLGAFAASVLTLIYTGLNVESRDESDRPTAAASERDVPARGGQRADGGETRGNQADPTDARPADGGADAAQPEVR